MSTHIQDPTMGDPYKEAIESGELLPGPKTGLPIPVEKPDRFGEGVRFGLAVAGALIFFIGLIGVSAFAVMTGWPR